MTRQARGPKRDRKTRGGYQRHDTYFHRARQQGYAARSVFKLDELQNKLHLIKPGQRVLDLGCAPGAWLQLAEKIVGQSGRIIGVDLSEVKVRLPSHVQTLKADIREVEPSKLCEMAGGHFAIVLSDLAPKTTGIRSVDQARSLSLVEDATHLALRCLRTGGHLVLKIFDGPDVKAFCDQLAAQFGKQSILRPKATRSHSKEIYVIAQDLRPLEDSGDSTVSTRGKG